MKQVLLLAIIIFPLLTLPSTESKHANGLTIDLIHRDSPFYDPSMTQREVTLNASMRSISRTNDFHVSACGNKEKTSVIPNSGDYLMKIFVGTPPVELLAIADTCVDLILVQYYEAVTQCRYSLSSITEGELASETIRFGSKDGPFITTPKTTLGCGNVNTENLKNTEKRVVGLGGGPLSLVSQLSHKFGHIFSYCLVPHTINSTSKLKMGRESTISPFLAVTTTPLVPSSQYTVPLKGVSVGRFNLEPSISLNIVIDSGTRLTYLETLLYGSVKTAFADAIDYETLENPPSPYELCYAFERIDFVPDITFHLSKGDINYPNENILVKVDDNLCLSIVPTSGISTLGNLAQMNFKVEYDLQKKTVSFAHADCTKE